MQAQPLHCHFDCRPICMGLIAYLYCLVGKILILEQPVACVQKPSSCSMILLLVISMCTKVCRAGVLSAQHTMVLGIVPCLRHVVKWQIHSCSSTAVLLQSGLVVCGDTCSGYMLCLAGAGGLGICSVMCPAKLRFERSIARPMHMLQGMGVASRMHVTSSKSRSHPCC